jgi:hypothetical protein
MRKFYYEDDGEYGFSVMEEGGGCEHGEYYDIAVCWVTDERDAKHLINLLHKLQGTKES